MVWRYGPQTGKCMAFDETEVGDVCQQMLLSMSCALDGRLNAQEQSGLSDHLAQCATCRKHSLELGAVDLLLSAVDHPAVGPLAPDLNFVRRVMTQVRLDAALPGGGREFARRAANDDLSDTQLDAMVGGTGSKDAALRTLIDELHHLFKSLD